MASEPERPRWSRRTAAHGLLGAIAVGVVATLLVEALLGYTHAWYGFFDVSDLPVYHSIAARCAAGSRAYVDFPLEYPPLALALFRVPDTTRGAAAYSRSFAALMFAGTALSGGAVAASARLLWPSRRHAPWAAACVHAAGVAAAGAIVANRFDAAVALAIALAVLAMAIRLPVLAALCLGAGFALKLTPLLLLPVVLLSRRTRRDALLCAMAFAGGAIAPFLPHLPAGGPGLLGMVRYHLARPLQIESALATPLLVARLVGGSGMHTGRSFGSEFLSGPGAGMLAKASGPLAISGVLLVYALLWRRRAALRSGAGFPLACLAVLLVAMATGKVLSPQYFVWLLPLAALVAPEHPRLAAGVVAVTLLTQLEFPALYWRFVALELGPVALVVARNVVLLSLGVASVIALTRLRDVGEAVRSA